MSAPTIVSRAGAGRTSGAVDADPITTEVIRHGLNSAAEQMKRALIRTAFSPVIYEVLDFAVAIYDRDVRLLAQAPSLPLFMGTMNFCVEAAVDAVGGEEALEPGDIILYNDPYGTGSHPQDAAVVMPVFLHDEELIGYTRSRAHWLDIGGKEPYSTDTVDVFQEGTIFPGVKLYRRGELVDGHLPDGDRELARAEDGRRRHQRRGRRRAHRRRRRSCASSSATGSRRFERVGRAHVRPRRGGRAQLLRAAPRRPLRRPRRDGRQRDRRRPGAVRGRASRSTARRARSTSRTRPTQQPGPINCPIPSTVSASRIAIAMLAGGGECAERGPLPADRGGHAARLDVPPAPAGAVLPLRLAGDPGDRGDLRGGLRRRMPDGGARLQRRRHLRARLVGRPRGDRRAVGRRLAAPGRPGRVGARRRREQPDPPRRGGDALLADRGVGGEEPVAARARSSSRQDSCGAGPRTAAASGVDLLFHMLEDSCVTSAVERTKNAAVGARGRRRGAAERGRAAAARRHAAASSARRPGCSCRRARRSSSTPAAAAATASPRERDPEAVRARRARGLRHARSTRARTTRTPSEGDP